jgi:hypothetical protein
VVAFIGLGADTLSLVLNELSARTSHQSCGPSGSATICASTPSISSDSLWTGRLVYGALLATDTLQAVSSYVPYPVERFANVWESDPGRVRPGDQGLRPSVSVVPVRGGGQLELGWFF